MEVQITRYFSYA